MEFTYVYVFTNLVELSAYIFVEMGLRACVIRYLATYNMQLIAYV